MIFLFHKETLVVLTQEAAEVVEPWRRHQDWKSDLYLDRDLPDV